MIKSFRALLARERTLTITPKKNGGGGISLVGGGRASWSPRGMGDDAAQNLTLISQ
jgi:hypothetical protein